MKPQVSTYQQRAYDYVREQIINLAFKPGEYVTDVQIADALNISRTPVREAFQRLEKEGLLVNEARRGWRVYMLDLEDIHEIFELKITIEGMLIRKAAKCTDEHLRKDLADALNEMKEAVKSDDANVWMQADIHLHNILFLMSNNERAEKIVCNLNDQWHRLRLAYDALIGRTHVSVGEHEAFIECVLAGDGEKAEELMRYHLTRVREDLMQLVVKVLMPYTDKVF
jgi:DNA-binding GntR family transcriptional regulator